ncbi:hypothetical protein EAI_09833 [Harpegnathos saltator]|uniref:Uncharacterized protein n=1 Tax=Harpegnathos saltator TaxID=610380 RepID=E2BY68_HARSA|nr:hypothetical protein EAI_09833 [Harpegnathos saltator]
MKTSTDGQNREQTFAAHAKSRAQVSAKICNFNHPIMGIAHGLLLSNQLNRQTNMMADFCYTNPTIVPGELLSRRGFSMYSGADNFDEELGRSKNSIHEITDDAPKLLHCLQDCKRFERRTSEELFAHLLCLIPTVFLQ